METEFIEILNNYLDDDASLHSGVNLKELGLDSMSSIELLLELEDYYDITIPDEFLTEETFSSTHNLWNVIQSNSNEN
ncbi:phosphopantetheine-binding protein [Oceanobacillus sp. CFH 90083]|uniref:phosphopantetheine-binding protein n=1 Tax=Oceanobacillus sp. CFH 90083 TaxID=2592336 RepID=UPI00128C22AA|nr:phosphopantetheine-binding protein [Oceanobacillus sp. CFH 90083]